MDNWSAWVCDARCVLMLDWLKEDAPQVTQQHQSVTLNLAKFKSFGMS